MDRQEESWDAQVSSELPCQNNLDCGWAITPLLKRTLDSELGGWKETLEAPLNWPQGSELDQSKRCPIVATKQRAEKNFVGSLS